MPPLNFEALTLPGVLAIAVVALWRKLDQKDAGWPELAKALRKDATKSGTWSHMDILVVTSPPASQITAITADSSSPNLCTGILLG